MAKGGGGRTWGQWTAHVWAPTGAAPRRCRPRRPGSTPTSSPAPDPVLPIALGARSAACRPGLSPPHPFARKEVPVIPPETQPRQGGQRDLFFFTHPEGWDRWPLLPVVRRHTDGTMDCGVLYDCAHTSGRMGYSGTVFLSNIFLLPETEEALLALPKETFDTPEELLGAGWTVD